MRSWVCVKAIRTAYKIVWLRVNGFAKGNATPPHVSRMTSCNPEFAEFAALLKKALKSDLMTVWVSQNLALVSNRRIMQSEPHGCAA